MDQNKIQSVARIWNTVPHEYESVFFLVDWSTQRLRDCFWQVSCCTVYAASRLVACVCACGRGNATPSLVCQRVAWCDTLHPLASRLLLRLGRTRRCSRKTRPYGSTVKWWRMDGICIVKTQALRLAPNRKDATNARSPVVMYANASNRQNIKKPFFFVGGRSWTRTLSQSASFCSSFFVGVLSSFFPFLIFCILSAWNLKTFVVTHLVELWCRKQDWESIFRSALAIGVRVSWQANKWFLNIAQ